MAVSEKSSELEETLKDRRESTVRPAARVKRRSTSHNNMIGYRTALVFSGYACTVRRPIKLLAVIYVQE